MTDFVDLMPETADFRRELLEGLARDQKQIHYKFLYDERGSELFEQICRLDAYYLTRTELAIMEASADEMAEAIGARARIVEFGSGSGVKTRLLLDALDAPVTYFPVDISASALSVCADRLREEFPDLEIVPIRADYTAPFDLPDAAGEAERTAAYFPGSTVGNFLPRQVVAFLRRVAELVGPGGGLLIGVDLDKRADTLEAAYDDDEGVTAAFTSNLLRRANREAGANFDLDGFEHEAVYNEEEGRIEIAQVSLRSQTVEVGDEAFEFEPGERLAIEYSYKYTPERFRGLVDETPFRSEGVWTDDRDRFSVWYLEVSEKAER